MHSHGHLRHDHVHLVHELMNTPTTNISIWPRFAGLKDWRLRSSSLLAPQQHPQTASQASCVIRDPLII